MPLPSIADDSKTIERFKEQYGLQKKFTPLQKFMASNHTWGKVLLSSISFVIVMVVGGFVTLLLERSDYDDIVERDTVFREEIQNALNNTDLFDRLEARYATWSLDNPWTAENSVFYWLTVMTTIGYGNIVPMTTGGRLWTVIFGVMSIFTSAMTVRIIANSHLDLFTRSSVYKNYTKTCHVAFLLLSVFVFAGVFYAIERNTGLGPMGTVGWSYAESLYFVVITCTTVGFGDFVPDVGPTFVLIIYGIIVVSMILREAQLSISRLENDMRTVIELAEQGFEYARQTTELKELNEKGVSGKDHLDIDNTSHTNMDIFNSQLQLGPLGKTITH